MSAYRVYLLAVDDRIEAIYEVPAPDDRSVLAIARNLGRLNAAIEIWQGERMVARLGDAFSLGDLRRWQQVEQRRGPQGGEHLRRRLNG